MNGRRARMPVLAVALALFGSCAATAQQQRPYPAPEATTLLAALRARQAAVRSIDLDTRTTSWLGGQRTRGTVVMLVERGGRLRFEAEVSLQGAVATLVTNEDRFALLDLQAHLFKQGEACPHNVASLVPVPLLPAEVAAILLGDALITPEARPLEVGWDTEARADTLALDNGTVDGKGQGMGMTAHVLVKLRAANPNAGSAARWDIVGVEGEVAGQTQRWRVVFDDLKEDGGFAFPQVIRFAEPGKSFDDGVEIKVKSRRVNPTFKPQAFTLAAPEGYPVEVVPCCPGCPTR
jgi:hypothetical protein